MTFESDLKAHLQEDAEISELVADRIYPLIIHEGKTVPAITYTQPSGQPLNSLDGYTSGKRRIDLQIDCWSLSFTTLARLADAVRDRMGMAAANFTPLVTQYPLLEDYEADTKRYRRSIGVSCWFTE